MRRREFFGILGGAVALRPTALVAQNGAVRRLGVLEGGSAANRDAQKDLTAFTGSLKKLGWDQPANLQMVVRWLDADPARARVLAKEIVALNPDVILAVGIPAVAALREQTQKIPIIFTRVSDPIGQGFVSTLAKPGANVTGFSNFDTEMGGKWLEILKDFVPGTSRVAVVANPKTSAMEGYFRSVATASQPLNVKPFRMAVENAQQVSQSISAIDEAPGTGLIVLPDPVTISNRAVLIDAANRRKLPGIYPFRFFASDGGLLAYGVNTEKQHRSAASYVDRILKGEKVSDLPVQAPSTFELVVNLRTAKTIGLTIPESLLLRADEVIE